MFGGLGPLDSHQLRFQVFFLSLVRPKAGQPDWSRIKEEYDKRYGFPAPEMSAALFEMFSAFAYEHIKNQKHMEFHGRIDPESLEHARCIIVKFKTVQVRVDVGLVVMRYGFRKTIFSGSVV